MKRISVNWQAAKEDLRYIKLINRKEEVSTLSQKTLPSLLRSAALTFMISILDSGK